MEHDDTGLTVLSGLSDPVRRRLYEFVAGHDGPATRDEAAAATGTGRPLAAYHLDKLVDLGLLAASYQRQPGRRGPGAGRPAKVYTRSDSEFTASVPPREYELAARLLATAVESDPHGACRAALTSAATQLGRKLAEPLAGGRSPVDARHTVMSVLRAHGYEPWLDSGGSIRLRNCPFHQLAVKHPNLVCGMNLAMISGMAAASSGGQLHPVLDPQPGPCCVVIGTGPRDTGPHEDAIGRPALL